MYIFVCMAVFNTFAHISRAYVLFHYLYFKGLKTFFFQKEARKEKDSGMRVVGNKMASRENSMPRGGSCLGGYWEPWMEYQRRPGWRSPLAGQATVSGLLAQAECWTHSQRTEETLKRF